MDDIEILLAEYNNLWNEKILHKTNIRKFHNYLTYITAIGSLALTFHGISTTDIFKATTNPDIANNLFPQARNILLLFFVPFAPVLLLTLTFPLNDLFHIYIIGTRIGEIEKKINNINDKKILLQWEHEICPATYGKNIPPQLDKVSYSMTNIISASDYLLLIPLLIIIGLFTTDLGFAFLLEKTSILLSLIYLCLVGYMFSVVVILGRRLLIYSKGNISRLISYLSTTNNNKPNVNEK